MQFGTALTIISCALFANGRGYRFASKTYDFANEPSVLTNLKAASFVYASCDGGSHASQQNCTVHFNKDVFGSQTDRYCNVSLTAQLKHGEIGFEMDVVPWGSDRVILVWLEKHRYFQELFLVRITVINFSDDCKTTETEIVPKLFFIPTDLNVEDVVIVPNKDNFSVVFRKTVRQLGKEEGFYFKVNVDAEGNADKPRPWFSEGDGGHVKLYPLTRDSSSTNYLLELRDAQGSSFFLLKNEEKPYKTLNKIPLQWYYKISTAHDTIRICIKYSPNMECTQYDRDGNVKSRHRFEMNETDYPSAVFNLPDNEYLVTTVQSDAFTESAITRFAVTRIDAEGRRGRRIDIDDFACRGLWHKNANFVEYENGEFCTNFACPEMQGGGAFVNRKSGNYFLAKTCFSIQDF